MHRRTFLSSLATGVLTTPVCAQPSTKVVRIGVFTMARARSGNPLTNALIEGLRDHGYVDGRNAALEFIDAAGREDRLQELAADLVRKNLDVIVVAGPGPLEAARKATKTIPLVMVASSADPVAEGIARSLARPGGNVTGLTYAEPDRFKKQLEMLKTAASGVARAAVLWDFDLDTYRRFWEAPLTEAGRILGIGIQEPVRVRDERELPAAFSFIKHRADAVLVASGSFLFPGRVRVAELALQHKMPAIAAFKEFPQAGLLMSYGPDLPDINRRAAAYVDKILKGEKPADLPIELPNKFELVINLKTAAAIGIAVPQSLVLRANEVIRT